MKTKPPSHPPLAWAEARVATSIENDPVIPISAPQASDLTQRGISAGSGVPPTSPNGVNPPFAPPARPPRRLLKKFAFLVLAFLLVAGCAKLCASLFPSAAARILELFVASPFPSERDQTLGISLEGHLYPFPVEFLTVAANPHPLRLAYMRGFPANGSGRFVLLLHGKHFSGDAWKQTMQALMANGHVVIVPDQIGFGKSSKPVTRYSLEAMTTHTLQLLGHLNVDRFAIVGHCFGGMLAVRLAALHPARVTRLVLINPLGLGDPFPRLNETDLETVFHQELAATNATSLQNRFGDADGIVSAETFSQFADIRSRMAASAEFPRWARVSALTWRMISEQNIQNDLPRVEASTLWLVGEHYTLAISPPLQAAPAAPSTSPAQPLAAIVELAASRSPLHAVMTLPGAGYLPQSDHPDQLHQHLIPFLKL